MIQTVDNYQKIERDTNRYYFRFDKPKKYEKDVIGEKLEINLNDYQIKSLNNTFFSFFKDEEKTTSKNEDDLIISIKKDIGQNSTLGLKATNKFKISLN